MNLRIELPEILVLCSAALFISGINSCGWLFFGLGLFGSIFRLGVKIQEQQQQAEAVKDGVELLKESADDFISSLSTALSSNQEKKNRTNLN